MIYPMCYNMLKEALMIMIMSCIFMTIIIFFKQPGIFCVQ